MARQAGNILIEGTLDDLTFYKMYGKHYVRMKSSLTRKKVLKSPRFALTRMHANQLAEASRIASGIYKQIPKEDRNIQLFRSIVGKAKVLLAEGKEKEEVLELLMIEPIVKSEVIVVDIKNIEGSKAKGEIEDFEQRIKKRKSLKQKEQSGLLLVNEVGNLIDKFYKANTSLSHRVLEAQAEFKTWDKWKRISRK